MLSQSLDQRLSRLLRDLKGGGDGLRDEGWIGERRQFDPPDTISKLFDHPCAYLERKARFPAPS